MSTFHRLRSVASRQAGAFTRDQAHRAGVTDRQLRSRVEAGLLEQVGPHAFRGNLQPADSFADLVALMLDIGDPVWASGPTAAALHGFDGFVLRRPFHLLLPRHRNVRRIGSIIHTTTVLPPIDRATVRGVRATSGARTVIDLARCESAERLTAALDSGLRDGRFSEDLLHRRIRALRSHGRYGVPRLLAVIEGSEITRGGHSWLEREFLRLLHRARLPHPRTQQVLSSRGDRLVRVDCRFEGTNVVVELLGYRWHRTADHLRRDAERLNALILDGFAPYQFTYEQVVGCPGPTIATVSSALTRAELRSA